MKQNIDKKICPHQLLNSDINEGLSPIRVSKTWQPLAIAQQGQAHGKGWKSQWYDVVAGSAKVTLMPGCWDLEGAVQRRPVLCWSSRASVWTLPLKMRYLSRGVMGRERCPERVSSMEGEGKWEKRKSSGFQVTPEALEGFGVHGASLLCGSPEGRGGPAGWTVQAGSFTPCKVLS